DREAAARYLEGAVLREESALGAAVDTDDRPVHLLSGKAARVGAARRLAGQSLKEGIRGVAEREVLDLDLGQPVGAGRPLPEREAQESRFLVGEEECVGPPGAVRDSRYGSPAHAVAGQQDVVPRGVELSHPVDDQAAELARPAE